MVDNNGIEFNTEKHRYGVKCRKCSNNIRYISNAKCVFCYRIKSKRKSKRRQSAIKRATPIWANLQKIKEIYERARSLGMSVDHIWPLKHSKFCGLHVETNLQIISIEENSKKKNKRPD